MSDSIKDRLESIRKEDTFSFIRFAEWRPQTLSAEITVEIPTLAMFMKDEYFLPVNFNLWLELSVYSYKHITTISKRIEELIDASYNSTKDNFRSFPPSSNSFNLIIHILKYDHREDKITEITEEWNGNELFSAVNRGFSWDLEKRLKDHYTDCLSDTSWDPRQWNLKISLDYFRSNLSTINSSSSVVNYHGLLVSGWHSTGNFSEVLESQTEFEQNLNISLLILAPLTYYTGVLAETLGLSQNYFLAKNFDQNLNNWKRKLLNNVEPKLVLTMDPHETWGVDFSSATNSALFQDVKTEENRITFYNLKSIRYPLRINWLYNLPVEALEQQLDSFNPQVWDRLKLSIQTSSGSIIHEEVIPQGITYRLEQNSLQYQPERELNERMRLADNLKSRLEQLLAIQSERQQVITKMIAEPQLLQKQLDHHLILNSLNDLKLAFEILDYLSEEELLVAEIPTISKMFQPPESDLLSGFD